MVVRMRITRAKVGSRRSHHALGKPAFSTCANCGAAKVPHRMCLNCGTYNKRKVFDVAKEVSKKTAKKSDKKSTAEKVDNAKE